jgi:hypothetical protein
VKRIEDQVRWPANLTTSSIWREAVGSPVEAALEAEGGGDRALTAQWEGSLGNWGRTRLQLESSRGQ